MSVQKKAMNESVSLAMLSDIRQRRLLNDVTRKTRLLRDKAMQRSAHQSNQLNAQTALQQAEAKIAAMSSGKASRLLALHSDKSVCATQLDAANRALDVCVEQEAHAKHAVNEANAALARAQQRDERLQTLTKQRTKEFKRQLEKTQQAEADDNFEAHRLQQ